MYDRLLLCKQGGIIDISHMAEQDNSVHICIGLGGTGVDCLKNLKAKVYNRIRPDNPNSSVPRYSHIKFLAVDSDMDSIKYDEKSRYADFCKLDFEKEVFHLGQGVKFLKVDFDSDPTYREWFEYRKIKACMVGPGANAIRQVGRFFLISQAGAFCDLVRNMIFESIQGLSKPAIFIHVFTGLGGGTGSGSFLDVCYLIREVIKRNEFSRCYLCGYFFLPDVNIVNGLHVEIERVVRANGYASLQELDYCMNFERNGDKWSQYYNGVGLVESKRMPVDIGYLLSASNTNGNIYNDGYYFVMNTVAEHIISLIVNNTTHCFEGDIGKHFAFNGCCEKEYGANYDYCSLGVSTSGIPTNECLTYLASAIFEKMAVAVKDIVPTKNDCDEFINKNALSYDRIFAQLTYGADLTAFPLNDVRWRDALANDDLTVTYFTNMANRSYGKIDENYTALSREIKKYYDDTEALQDVARSLITKIFVALKDIACDNKYGPFYAARLLRSNTGVDLLAIVDGYLKEAQGKLVQENAQEDKLYPEWKKAQDEFFASNTGSFNGERRFKKYANATRQLNMHRAKAAAISRMVDLMRLLHDQLIKLSTGYMDVLVNTVNHLIDTFDENKRYLDSGVIKHVSYEMPIATLNDVMPDLKSTIAEMDVGQNITRVMRSLTSKEGVDAWIDNNENDISVFIIRYFTDLFPDYSQKTLADYFRMKYRINEPEALSNVIEHDYLYNMIHSSNPALWSAHQYYVFDAWGRDLFFMPYNAYEVEHATRNMMSCFVFRCGYDERVVFIRHKYCIPLFAYEGIYRYERDSLNGNIVGQHIYEGKQYFDGSKLIQGRNWKHLPSPIPFRLMCEDFSSPELMHLAEEAKDLYSEAEANGVIHEYDSYDFGIFTISDAFMCSFRNAFEDGKKKENKDDKLQAKEQLEQLSKNIEYNSPIPIPNDCSLSEVERKREVRIEHFVKSPCLQKIVRAELEKLKEINEAIHYLD
ncbi:tubulin-like doman-containing protein [Butyrivibrio sp. AE2032]|uniref:tubulin-like doman-containing protein n=1 Tax=Butyrivibrio sp. AE2032 TaxID=1458463 RepID=UPI000558FBE3|nr:tubulin-like doman-containing protein [Butyrivibrio sp. AE2032]